MGQDAPFRGDDPAGGLGILPNDGRMELARRPIVGCLERCEPQDRRLIAYNSMPRAVTITLTGDLLKTRPHMLAMLHQCGLPVESADHRTLHPQESCRTKG